MGQLVYTMFVTNNHASFQLLWNENVVKHQKVSKYYTHDWITQEKCEVHLRVKVIVKVDFHHVKISL